MKYCVKFLEENKVAVSKVDLDVDYSELPPVDDETYQDEKGKVDQAHELFMESINSTFDLFLDEIPDCHIDYIKHDGEGNLIADYSLQESEQELLRINKLKENALAYQSAQQSQNELGLLHGYSVAELEMKPKAQAQINWMTSLFILHEQKIVDKDNHTPFSSVGDKPHSFTELHLEKFGDE